MKISPLAPGAHGQPSTVNPGHSASPERIARAKAIITGDPAPAPAEPQQRESTAQQLRKIRMNTNATPPGRDWTPPEPIIAEPAVAEPHIPDTIVDPALAAPEDPKPLSPQFAALMKNKRALDAREKAITAREEAIKQTSQSTTDAKALVERIKADPLGLLLENGVTYDQLTQAVLKDMEGGGPALTRVESELRKELKTLQEKLDLQVKTQTDTWNEAQENALNQMQRQAEQIIAAGDDYQMIRDTNSQQDVKRLIKQVFDDEGVTLEVKEALDLLENDLLEESLKYARIPKVQQKLKPEPSTQQQQAPPPQDGVRRQTMRTLSNRDTVSAIPSRRDRAMAAALGRKIA